MTARKSAVRSGAQTKENRAAVESNGCGPPWREFLEVVNMTIRTLILSIVSLCTLLFAGESGVKGARGHDNRKAAHARTGCSKG
jgi:hypothetical protein